MSKFKEKNSLLRSIFSKDKNTKNNPKNAITDRKRSSNVSSKKPIGVQDDSDGVYEEINFEKSDKDSEKSISMNGFKISNLSKNNHSSSPFYKPEAYDDDSDDEPSAADFDIKISSDIIDNKSIDNAPSKFEIKSTNNNHKADAYFYLADYDHGNSIPRTSTINEGSMPRKGSSFNNNSNVSINPSSSTEPYKTKNDQDNTKESLDLKKLKKNVKIETPVSLTNIINTIFDINLIKKKSNNEQEKNLVQRRRTMADVFKSIGY